MGHDIVTTKLGHTRNFVAIERRNTVFYGVCGHSLRVDPARKIIGKILEYHGARGKEKFLVEVKDFNPRTQRYTVKKICAQTSLFDDGKGVFQCTKFNLK